MQFFTTILFALASTGVMAKPVVDTKTIVHKNGFNLRLVNETAVERLDQDGKVMDTAKLSPELLAEFKTLAGQPLDGDLVERAYCQPGLACDGNAICWFNSCDICISGGCFGTTW